MKALAPLVLTALLTPLSTAQAADIRPPSQIIGEAPASHWRQADPENTLYLDTSEGRIIIELAEVFAPGHARNLKALAREEFYDGLAMYRVVEGFVAQGGDQSGEKPIEGASRTIPAEFTLKKLPPEHFTALSREDGYAAQTGFVDGFPAGRNPASGETWMTHCQGAFAMARGQELDSGGTEFYIVIGQAQRYLDRNTTVFGRVLDGMTVLQRLNRGSGAMGILAEPERNQIRQIRVAADLPPAERVSIEVMDTGSESFRELMAARRNRPEDWFVHRPDYVDVCSVGVPVRIAD